MAIKQLEGSPGRDRFKWAHKQAGFPRQYASDLDFGYIEKYPEPHTVAFSDFKQPGDEITFAEAILYNDLLDVFPGYIIRAKTDVVNTPLKQHRFDVERIESVLLEEYSPNQYNYDIETTRIHSNIPWGGHVTYNGDIEIQAANSETLIGWEENLRNQPFEEKWGGGHD